MLLTGFDFLYHIIFLSVLNCAGELMCFQSSPSKISIVDLDVQFSNRLS